MCRKVSAEAIEAFFDVNAIRARSLGVITSPSFEKARYLEMSGEAEYELCHGATTVGCLAGIIGSLRKLKSVMIPFDTVTRSDGKTVRQMILEPGNGAEVRCIDIGVFEIMSLEKDGDEDSYGALDKTAAIGSIYFKHLGLRRVLREAKKYMEQYPLGDLIDAGYYGIDQLAEEVDSWESAKARCAAFLRLYEVFRSTRAGDMSAFNRLSSEDMEELGLVADELLGNSSLVPEIHPDLPREVKLEDITSEHGSELLLEWATEVLSLMVWVDEG